MAYCKTGLPEVVGLILAVRGSGHDKRRICSGLNQDPDRFVAQLLGSFGSESLAPAAQFRQEIGAGGNESSEGDKVVI
jgi:hypothetical protein